MMSDYLESLFSLRGKVALVTGASRGIGKAVVTALTSAGAYTLGIGRSSAPQEAFPAGAEYRQCNILEREQFSSICADVYNSQGRLDILVNAAGITLPQAALTSLENVDDSESFERTLSTNLTAVYYCCRVAAVYMQKNAGGSMVNITSIGSVLGFPGNPAYVASKGGLRLLTKGLAMDLAAANIRVNNIAPGYIRTDMTEASYQDPQRRSERLQNMMIKRWGNVQDLAGAVIFLASSASSYVTGADLFVDGGWTAKGL